MPIISREFLEQTESLLAEAETEKQSFADELAEVKLENESLRAQLSQLMSDRSLAV